MSNYRKLREYIIDGFYSKLTFPDSLEIDYDEIAKVFDSIYRRKIDFNEATRKLSGTLKNALREATDANAFALYKRQLAEASRPPVYIRL